VREPVPYDLTPQQDGRWSGGLSLGKWLGIVVTLVIETSIVTFAVLAVLDVLT
jgi:hypothetical protein